MSSQPPLVSIVMTTYNGVRFLRETIDSVLGQTLVDFEFLIVDDCSKDDTVALIRSYADARIRLVCNDSNQGISESRNRALSLARGALIATTDQDDVSEPDRLQRQVAHLEAHPEDAAVACRVYVLSDGRRSEDPMPTLTDPVLIHFAVYFGRHNTTYSSMCVRRQFLVDHDLYFRQQYHYAEDFELFSRIVEHGRFGMIADALVGYRLHASNNSTVHRAEMSRNGMSFMRACYERMLMRPVDEPEGWRIWNGLIEKFPQESLAELRALAELITELASRFVERHAAGADARQAVLVLAAQIWNDIVDRSVRAFGPAAERVRREPKELLAWQPSTLSVLGTNARGLWHSIRATR